MPGCGTATVDFGAFPGKSDATVDVAAAGVVATSVLEAWVHPKATADHSVDEHKVESIGAKAEYLSDGNIRLTAYNTSEITEQPLGHLSSGQSRTSAGRGTRLYGQWTLGWAWSAPS